MKLILYLLFDLLSGAALDSMVQGLKDMSLKDYKSLKARERLGLPQQFNDEQRKANYRKLSMQFHPDRTDKQPLEVRNVLTEKFKLLNSANEALENPSESVIGTYEGSVKKSNSEVRNEPFKVTIFDSKMRKQTAVIEEGSSFATYEVEGLSSNFLTLKKVGKSLHVIQNEENPEGTTTRTNKPCVLTDGNQTKKLIIGQECAIQIDADTRVMVNVSKSTTVNGKQRLSSVLSIQVNRRP